MTASDKANAQRPRQGQATDPRTGRDEDDHPIAPPRTASVYEEDPDGLTTPLQQSHDAGRPK